MIDRCREYLIRIDPSRPGMLSDGGTAEENALIDRHFRYLSDLTDKGIVVLAGRTEQADSPGFGIVLLRAESEQHAIEILHGDPAIIGGVFRGQIFPFRMALCAHPTAGEGSSGA